MGEQTICAPPTGAGIFIGNKGEIAMHKLRPGFAVFYVLAMLMLSAVVLRAAPQDASFVGSWAMTVTNSKSVTRRVAAKMLMTLPSPATPYPGQRNVQVGTATLGKSSTRPRCAVTR